MVGGAGGSNGVGGAKPKLVQSRINGAEMGSRRNAQHPLQCHFGFVSSPYCSPHLFSQKRPI
ncbi:uncharacterized protein PgNI_11592 [Pyricularia grisea]|uniref:Uncharacterized protein n=1 Tax=Pyricularia grisea TaxID=148305 RepID=A0A6P8ANZ3_PYRGI|nr:uncharacterized protein PgNI_11592 [Pyricularia grisea]TLD03764.1 hypothetical protein PgNI_11592 [Pyricularia grisea]